uniref:Uncharacterized protein n=1 Tax=Rhizophora mucronata TaxID=61149 RepID=A0A2P2NGR2_RHIMU
MLYLIESFSSDSR